MFLENSSLVPYIPPALCECSSVNKVILGWLHLFLNKFCKIIKKKCFSYLVGAHCTSLVKYRLAFLKGQEAWLEKYVEILMIILVYMHEMWKTCFENEIWTWKNILRLKSLCRNKGTCHGYSTVKPERFFLHWGKCQLKK